MTLFGWSRQSALREPDAPSHIFNGPLRAEKVGRLARQGCSGTGCVDRPERRVSIGVSVLESGV